MALTQISNKCLLCQQEMLPNTRAIFVGVVGLVDWGRRRHWDTDVVPAPIREGKLRIQHLVGGKPRGVFHEECFDTMFQRGLDANN